MSNTYLYVPKSAKIPDKVCVVCYRKNILSPNSAIPMVFSPKINQSPYDTVAIVDNLFTGPFTISRIKQANANFYSLLTIENMIQSDMNPKFTTNVIYWALNEIFMSGIVRKDGKIEEGVEFVGVTYGAYSTVVIKDGELYNKILGK